MARPGGWLDWVAKTLQLPVFPEHSLSAHGLNRQGKWAFYPVKASNLYRSYTERRLASSPKADPFVAPRLVDVNEII